MHLTCPHCKYEWETDKRSAQANAFFHVIVSKVSKDTGNDFNEVKDMLKWEGGFYKEIHPTIHSDKIIVKLEETHSMDKYRMAELIDFAFMYANSIGVSIETPEAYKEWKLKMSNHDNQNQKDNQER